MLLPITLLASAIPVCALPQGDAPPTHPQRTTPIRQSGHLPEIERGTPPLQEKLLGRGTPTIPAPSARPGRSLDSTIDAAAIDLTGSFDRHAVVHQDFVNGVHWARGRTYKAKASSEGFTYIPFFGSNAPRTWPVQFQLASIERDGVELKLSDHAAVRREGSRWILDRGDVEVWYDLDVEQVEQSFAFAAPDGAGDVTLRLDVSTELEVRGPSAQGASDSLEFTGEFGHLTYSEAIVLDAHGRRADVRSRWVDGSIELTVPAAFVASAEGRIVVDPILTTSVIDGFSDELLFPDLAYDKALDRYLVVYEEVFAATDLDVYSRFVSAIGLIPSGGAYIELTADTWQRPKVAQLPTNGRFLVVAEGESALISGSTDITGRMRNADGTLEAPMILKSATSSYGCESPDVGGEAIDVPLSYYCLVFNRNYGTDRDVYAVVLDRDGHENNAELQLAGFISRDEGAPAVSKNSGLATLASGWNVAWATEDLNGSGYKVQAAQVGFTGSTAMGPFDVTPFSATQSYFDVEVSSLCGRRQPGTNDLYWVVTYDDSPSSITDAYVALCAGITVASTEELQVIEHHPKIANENNVVIGTLEDHFLFAYTSGGDLVATIAQPIQDRLGMTERRLLGGGRPTGGMLAIATTHSGGGTFDDGTIVWSEFDGTDQDIFGAQIIADSSFVAAGTQYCYGESNSTGDHGYMLAFGDREPLNPQTLFASALPLNAFGFFLASTDQGLAPAAGGSTGTLCLSGSIGRFGIFNSGSGGRGVITIDPQAIAQPTGSVAAIGGETWHFQVWHRDATGGSATSNFTNAVSIRFL